MKQVADWQISNPNTAHEHHDLDWTNGAKKQNVWMHVTIWYCGSVRENM